MLGSSDRRGFKTWSSNSWGLSHHSHVAKPLISGGAWESAQSQIGTEHDWVTTDLLPLSLYWSDAEP